MTAQELVEEVFRMAGKPSNLQIYATPGDDLTFNWALPGVTRLLRYINLAINRIASWKYPDGRVLRLNCLVDRSRFTVDAPLIQTVTAAGLNYIEVSGRTLPTMNEFQGYVVEITSGLGAGQSAYVVSSGVANRLILNSDLGTIPLPGDTVALYKNYFPFYAASIPGSITDDGIILDPVNVLMDVLKVRDISAFSDLTKPYHDALFTTSMMQVGVPTQYRIGGKQLEFDVAVGERRSYEMLFVRQPLLLQNAGDVPEIPLQYHEAVLLWALHTVQRLYQDLDGAYATKRELEDLMAQLRMQGHFSNDYESSGLTVWG